MIFAWLIPIVALLAALLWGLAAYNGLVRLRNQVANAWGQIDVQLKRRHDLIPNLVNTVKGYAAHERETLEAVVAARQQATQARSVAATAEAEAGLSRALGRLFALAEGYPDLKANHNFQLLQEELAATENRIGFARQCYNDRVMELNTRVESFPSNLVARMGGFRTGEFLAVESAAERDVPVVQFA